MIVCPSRALRVAIHGWSQAAKWNRHFAILGNFVCSVALCLTDRSKSEVSILTPRAENRAEWSTITHGCLRPKYIPWIALCKPVFHLRRVASERSLRPYVCSGIRFVIRPIKIALPRQVPGVKKNLRRRGVGIRFVRYHRVASRLLSVAPAQQPHRPHTPPTTLSIITPETLRGFTARKHPR